MIEHSAGRARTNEKWVSKDPPFHEGLRDRSFKI